MNETIMALISNSLTAVMLVCGVLGLACHCCAKMSIPRLYSVSVGCFGYQSHNKCWSTQPKFHCSWCILFKQLSIDFASSGPQL